MGFTSVSLEGKEAHEALLNRQDFEIRLLEQMRKCISLKVKHDKDYAAALTSVATEGQKMDKCEDMKESSIFKAWKVLTEELENLGQLFKSNAEVMEKETLIKLNTMCAEKRKAKKHYQDEYNRLCQQFSILSEEVIKKRKDYSKYLEEYRLLRSRFEKQYFECGHSGKKLEDVREKYQKACRKLHQVHNEYVLLITDAQETRRDFNSILLPYLLEQQQAIFQNFMSTWQTLLKDLVQCWNVPVAQFTECCNNSENAINNIKPPEEYRMLINKLNGVHTSENSDFTFDNSLVEDTTGKLLPNQLTVDNLTVEWVRKKMADLEVMLKECQISLSNCDNCINKENSIDLTVSELRSKERKLTRQIEVIKKALSEIGCEELPNGCDLDNSFDQNNDIQPLNRVSLKRASLSSLHQNSTSPTSQSSIVDKFWKTIRRKSAPNSPELGSRSFIGNNNEQPSSGVGANIRVIANIEASSPLQLPNNVAHDFYFTNTNSDCGLVSSMKSLVDEEWFHGVLPRDEVVRLLRAEGDFLVRETERNNEKQAVLSVLWGGRDKHFIVQTTSDGEYRFEGPAFVTINDLIRYQYENALPVTNRSGAILKHPIPRERWELNNDDVHLVQKIGKGNFGDVYKAVLLSSNEEVAVKTCRVTVPDEYKRKFLQEGRILKQYDHPNIVKFIGICVQKQPIMIVMELVSGGSLLSFLRKNASSLSCYQLLLMCRDTAAGMSYLESKNCIHRDLAARNCLVGNENTVKISDFGMSREEEEYIVSDGMKQIPIKWTAPEALNFGKYTSLCDVWSYGVLMWEIFSKGDNPYLGLSNTEARTKIDLGYRMPAPEGTPKEIYQLMLSCWEYKPEKRPHFDKILKIIDMFVKQYSC